MFVRKTKNKCHSRVLLSGIYNACRYGKDGETTCVEDPRLQASGMTSLYTKAGFTLIEVLIVVVIIAVLTAVAVPMYKRAVLKSQFSTLMPLAKNLWEGNEVFYLNNGEYAASVDELDVSAPVDPKVQATLGDEEKHQYVRVSKTDVPNRLTMYQKHSPNFPGETHCEALLDNDPANWLCKDGLQGTFVGNKFGYAVYSLSPDTVGTLARIYHNGIGRTLQDGDQCIADEEYGCSGQSARNHATVQDGSCRAGSAHACYYTDFVRSSCYADKGDGGCNQSNFTDHSSCTGVAGWSCAATYDEGSICYGESGTACYNSHFSNSSICQANIKGACGGPNISYDQTSYCQGLYCPVGQPKQNGGTWRECEEGEEGYGIVGRTC